LLYLVEVQEEALPLAGEAVALGEAVAVHHHQVAMFKLK